MSNIKKLGLACLAIFMVFIISSYQVAQALTYSSYNTTGNVAQVYFAPANNNPTGQNVFVTLSGLTQVTVENADTNTLIRSFNMSNALMNGFNIVYGVTDMSCNDPSNGLCVAGYTTGGSGNCALSPNLCKERVVIFNWAQGTWSALTAGANYTYASQILDNVALSFGSTQDTIFATVFPNGGGQALIDSWVTNATVSLASAPSLKLLFGNSFNTGTSVNYGGIATLGTFTSGGNVNNYMAIASPSTNSFVTFKRSQNLFGCTFTVGLPMRSVIYQSDSVGTFWWAIAGHTVYKVDSGCNQIASADIGSLNGNTNLNSLAIDGTRHEVYTESQANGKTTMFVLNETSLSTTPVNSFIFSSDTGQFNGIAVEPNGSNGVLAYLNGGSTKVSLIYWNAIGGGGGGGGGGKVCVNTIPSATSQSLVCWTVCDPSGIANTSCPSSCPNNAPTCPYVTTNSFATLMVGQNLTSSTGQLTCSLGVTNCSNSNILTNGVGYILTLLLIIGSIGFIWQIASWTEHSIGELPPFIWFAILAIDLGISAGLHWTDGVIFYTTIIGAIGLGALGIGSFILGGRKSA